MWSRPAQCGVGHWRIQAQHGVGRGRVFVQLVVGHGHVQAQPGVGRDHVPTWGRVPCSCQGKVKAKPAPTPRGVWLAPAHGQINPSARYPHLGAWAWPTPWTAPPKLEVTIFFQTITSMSNASYKKYSPIPLSLPFATLYGKS